MQAVNSEKYDACQCYDNKPKRVCVSSPSVPIGCGIQYFPCVNRVLNAGCECCKCSKCSLDLIRRICQATVRDLNTDDVPKERYSVFDGGPSLVRRQQPNGSGDFVDGKQKLQDNEQPAEKKRRESRERRRKQSPSSEETYGSAQSINRQKRKRSETLKLGRKRRQKGRSGYSSDDEYEPTPKRWTAKNEDAKKAKNDVARKEIKRKEISSSEDTFLQKKEKGKRYKEEPKDKSKPDKIDEKKLTKISKKGIKAKSELEDSDEEVLKKRENGKSETVKGSKVRKENHERGKQLKKVKSGDPSVEIAEKKVKKQAGQDTLDKKVLKIGMEVNDLNSLEMIPKKGGKRKSTGPDSDDKRPSKTTKSPKDDIIEILPRKEKKIWKTSKKTEDEVAVEMMKTNGHKKGKFSKTGEGISTEIIAKKIEKKEIRDSKTKEGNTTEILQKKDGKKKTPDPNLNDGNSSKTDEMRKDNNEIGGKTKSPPGQNSDVEETRKISKISTIPVKDTKKQPKISVKQRKIDEFEATKSRIKQKDGFARKLIIGAKSKSDNILFDKANRKRIDRSRDNLGGGYKKTGTPRNDERVLVYSKRKQRSQSRDLSLERSSRRSRKSPYWSKPSRFDNIQISDFMRLKLEANDLRRSGDTQEDPVRVCITPSPTPYPDCSPCGPNCPVKATCLCCYCL